MHRLIRLFRRFGADDSGAFLVIFGVLAIVLVATSGAVVDYTSIEQSRTRAQVALDTASLGLQPAIYTSTIAELTTKAENLLVQQLGVTGGEVWSVCTDMAIPPCAQIDDLTTYPDEGKIYIEASIKVPTAFVSLIGFPNVTARLISETTRGSVDLEVAVALDITGSMSGSKIDDLETATKELIDIVVKDEQEPSYSRVALVPYSMGVNVGTYAAAVRGAVPAGKAITGASWEVAGSSRNVSGITKANPAVVTTSAAHGYATGDRIYLSGISGMSQVNNKSFTITVVNSTKFSLGVDSTWYNSYNSTSGDRSYECRTYECEVVVTSTAHGFENGDYVRIDNVGGMWQINDKTHEIEDVSANSYVLKDVVGTGYNSYSSGGSAWCTELGCEYYRFANAWWGTSTHRVSTCVSDRVVNPFNDEPPNVTPLGFNYPGSGNSCPGATIVPLSDNKVTLKAAVTNLPAVGSTAGQLGLAWGWYMLSPEFGYLWPTEKQRPAPYPEAHEQGKLLKVLILMTDGQFNTTYCNGVISKDSLSGSGSIADHINCDAPNGTGWEHAQALCTAIKAKGIELYTVGFDIDDEEALKEDMATCATSPAHAHVAGTGSDLTAVFKKIAEDISSLRLSR